jgi:hypothetical protein
MGADFPLLSNEILLPNLVFFRSLLDHNHPRIRERLSPTHTEFDTSR